MIRTVPSGSKVSAIEGFHGKVKVLVWRQPLSMAIFCGYSELNSRVVEPYTPKRLLSVMGEPCH